jgi:hypothetical protein
VGDEEAYPFVVKGGEFGGHGLGSELPEEEEDWENESDGGRDSCGGHFVDWKIVGVWVFQGGYRDRNSWSNCDGRGDWVIARIDDICERRSR